MNKTIGKKNLHIVITGASSGLGKAIAFKLGQEGANLYLLSRSINKTSFPFKTHKIQCDIKDPKQIQKALDQIPKIDILINCVGIPLVKRLIESTDSEIQNLIQTNLTGIILICKYALPKLKKSSNPFIINVISTSGKKARTNETVYCASKWGLSGFTQSLRLEVAPEGIKVIGIYPGGMKSENFWKGIKTREEIANYLEPSEVAEYIIKLLTLSKSSCPSEVVIERAKI